MEYEIKAHQLVFKSPFTIAHTSRAYTSGAYLHLKHGKLTSKGEIVFPPYYPENLASFELFMKTINLPISIEYLDLNGYLQKVLHEFPNDPFAVAALDIALHELLCKHSGRSIKSHFGIKGISSPTSYTIGISSNEEMTRKISQANSFEYYKLKVNQAQIERIVNHYLKICNKPFVVDANQGFTDKEFALTWAHLLHDYGVAYFEQPFHKTDLASHQWLTKKSPIPIIADESFQTINDIERIKHSFNGINIKLMKCGGILPAYHCFQKAKKHKLLTVLGCMSESEVAVNAANELSPLANWVDLDGPFLISKIKPLA